MQMIRALCGLKGKGSFERGLENRTGFAGQSLYPREITTIQDAPENTQVFTLFLVHPQHQISQASGSDSPATAITFAPRSPPVLSQEFLWNFHHEACLLRALGSLVSELDMRIAVDEVATKVVAGGF